MTQAAKLSKKQIDQQFAKLAGWKRTGDVITKEFILESFTGAARFITRIAPVANRMDHHPDLKLYHYKRVKIMLSTHDAGGLTRKDFILAAKIDKLG